MVKHIAKVVLGEDLYQLKDTEARSTLDTHASNTNIHVTAAEKEYWNSKVNPPSYSAPTAKQLIYTGEAQDLLNPGSSTSGSIQYSTDETNWSTTVPQGINAGTYTVYWKFAGSEIVYVDSTEITVTIAKANPTYTAPTGKSGLVYNANAQDLLNTGSTSDGTISYSEDGENWSSSVPSKTNAGNYVVYWKLTGDSNHNDVASTAISVSIAKVTPTVTAPTAKSGLAYTGSAQELVNAGSTDFGTLQYSTDNENWGTTIPSATDAGDYSVYYRVVGDSNINDVAAQSVSVSVAKNNRNVKFYDDNSHAYIDLGLPSGTLWATMNVGANAETDYGNWYKYGLGAATYDNSQTDYTGTENPLSSNVDTAAQVWGGNWHTPTNAQLNELMINTTSSWVTDYQGSGKNGYTFTANGQTVFFPAAGGYVNGSPVSVGSYGFYLSSTPSGNSNFSAFMFSNTGLSMMTGNRNTGFSVRGVIESSIKTTLEIGQTNTVEVITEGSPTITVVSSNTNVATVSGMTINAIGGGSTTITITVAGDSNYNEYIYSYTLKVPYPNGVYAIYADGSTRTAANADSNAIGVAVISDNCKFIIDKTNDTNAAWDSNYSTNGVIAGCFATDDSRTAKTNYTGVSNTNAIAAVASGGEAAKYCRSCSKTIAGKTVYGYLGACGEWQTVYDNKTTVNSIMSTIGGAVISNNYYWTSSLSLSDSGIAWALYWGSGYVDSSHESYDDYLVRAFYEIS